MTTDELEDKNINVFPSQLMLLLDNNASLRTILDILIETNKLDKEEIMAKYQKNRDFALNLLSMSDND